MPHRTRLAVLGCALGALLTAPPAHASSMPRADFGGRPVLGLGLGNGVSAAFDAPLGADMSLGAAINSGFVAGRTSSADVRFLYKVLRGHAQRPTIALLAGVQGGGAGLALGNFEPMAGAALAYGFTPRLTGRLNIVIGVLGRSGIGPSGLELAYRFSPTLEGTIGFNGRGDVLGLKLAL